MGSVDSQPADVGSPGRFGPPPPFRRIWPLGYVTTVAELAAAGLGDPAIADELGLTKAQVAGIRSRHQIPAGQPPGRQKRKRRPVQPPAEASGEGSPNSRWCALLEAADERTWQGMRRAACRALKLSSKVSDETLIAAAQTDPRTADELASAYLLAWGVKP